MSEKRLDKFDEQNIIHGSDSDVEYDVEYLDDWDSLELPETPVRRPPQKRIFNCEDCSYTTIHLSALRIHKMKHTNAKPFACNKCSYRAMAPHSLKRHILGKHRVEEEGLENLPTYECFECSYKSIHKSNLRAHMSRNHMNKQYKCDLCKYWTSYKQTLIRHIKVHYEKKEIYKCDLCSYVAKCKGHILGHLARIHNIIPEKAFKCDKCRFVTRDRFRLKRHLKKSLQVNLIQCKHCEFMTSYKCEYSIHRVTHPSNVKKGMKNKTCIIKNDNDAKSHYEGNSDQCEEHKEMTTKVSDPNIKYDKLRRYIIDTKCLINKRDIPLLEEKSSEERLYRCVRCDYRSVYKASVQHHYERLHTDNNIKPYKCVHCNYTTKTMDQIMLHYRRSKSELLFNCRNCSFFTYNRCQLRMHEKQEHCRYKCSHCNYSCMTKAAFTKHFTNNHQNETISCQFCDYKTTDKDKWLSHQSLHTGNKPFKCGKCDFSCGRNSLLVNHMKTHLNKKNAIYISESEIDKLKV